MYFNGIALSHFENSLKLYHHFLKPFCEKILVKSVKLLFLSMKSINPIQKYPHITELCACNLKIFAYLFLLPIHFLISFEIRSAPKLSK